MIRLALTLCVAIGSLPLLAQPITDKPAFSAGDRWRYSYINESNFESKKGIWSREIVRVIDENHIEVKWGDRVMQTDGALNSLTVSGGRGARLLARHPMQVGDKWKFSREFDHPNRAEEGSVRVVSYEQVTVPAGTFDCYLIEAEDTSYGGLETTMWFVTRWYCPKLKYIAKEVERTVTTTRAGIPSRFSQTAELIEFRVSR